MTESRHFAPFSNAQRGGIFSRLLFLIGFVILLFFLYLIRAPILREYASFFIVDDAPQHSDIIIMLGDDNFKGDRAAHAAEIFKAGWAPKVVASGRALRPYAGIAELEAHDLAADGVPESDIIRFSHSASDTHEECVFIGQLVAKNNWRRVIIVTSTYHTRRSRYICERTMPPGTILRMSAAKDSEFDPDNWWRTRKGLRIVFHESVGMIDSLWEMRHDEVKTRDSSLFSILPLALAGLSPP